jgi:hypothetical protein
MVSREYTIAHRKNVGKKLNGFDLINTGRRINQGVLVAGHGEDVLENVVVYWSKYSDETDYSLNTARKATLHLAKKKSNNPPNETPDSLYVEACFKHVSRKMSFDDNRELTKKLLEKHGNGSLMSLQKEFMARRRGLCRHQGLICAAVLERLHQEHRINGTGIINENLIDDDGHLWAEYINRDGRRIVLDPAKNYLGDPEGGPWNYNPEMGLAEINPQTL